MSIEAWIYGFLAGLGVGFALGGLTFFETRRKRVDKTPDGKP
jgi:hypothetical protein